jgi:hypothetical protein
MARGSRRVMEDRLRLQAQARQLAEDEAAKQAQLEADRKAYQARIAAEKLAQEAIEKIKNAEAPQALQPGDGGWKSKMNKASLASWLVTNGHSTDSADDLVENNTKAQLVELVEAALAASS